MHEGIWAFLWAEVLRQFPNGGKRTERFAADLRERRRGRRAGQDVSGSDVCFHILYPRSVCS